MTYPESPGSSNDPSLTAPPAAAEQPQVGYPGQGYQPGVQDPTQQVGVQDPSYQAGYPDQPYKAGVDPTYPTSVDPTYQASVDPTYQAGYPDQSYQAGYPDQSYQAGYPGYPVSGTPAGPGQIPVQGGYPAYGYPVVISKPTNGMAIASMVVAIVGTLGLCFYGLGGYLALVGAILGHISRKQIRERGENGDGMALAGVIVGWIAAGIGILVTIILVIAIVYAIRQDGASVDNY